MENLFKKNPEFCSLVTISFIVVTLMCDSGVMF